MRKLIIIVEHPEAGVNAVTERLRALGVAWAHYFSSVWFVVDAQDRPADWWIHQIAPLAGNGPLAVVEVAAGPWWARAPEAFGNWMKTVWKPPGPRVP